MDITAVTATTAALTGITAEAVTDIVACPCTLVADTGFAAVRQAAAFTQRLRAGFTVRQPVGSMAAWQVAVSMAAAGDSTVAAVTGKTT
jgi:hypothetical protein